MTAAFVCGVEIAPSAVERLERKYADVPEVQIVAGDVTAAKLAPASGFDVINAVGVMFHIVDDVLWRRALANLATSLAPSGLLLVGGQFGIVTENVQFHRADDFSSWEEYRALTAPRVRVNKRLRSLRMWTAAARDAGLEVLSLHITKRQRAVIMPQNNILVLGRSRSHAEAS